LAQVVENALVLVVILVRLRKYRTHS